MTDPVAHAKAYPFSIPGYSFVFEDGEARSLGETPVDRTGRYPVLAAGSNQSPEQLARKYASTGNTIFPAERATLHDFDVVYAAHLSSYGSVPATFQASPGTAVTVFVLWLDDAQLTRMHETEGNYSYDRFAGIHIMTDQGETITDAFAYSSKVGCLGIDGNCVALSEIGAVDRRFPALAQHAVQTRLRDLLSPEEHLDDFIHAHVHDAPLRLDRSRQLASNAIGLTFERQIIQRL